MSARDLQITRDHCRAAADQATRDLVSRQVEADAGLIPTDSVEALRAERAIWTQIADEIDTYLTGGLREDLGPDDQPLWETA